MDRLKLFSEALDKSKELYLKFSQAETIGSIIRQIEYLIEVQNGKNDRSRLDRIVLGVQAAREIDPLDLDLAELLYMVSDEAKKM